MVADYINHVTTGIYSLHIYNICCILAKCRGSLLHFLNSISFIRKQVNHVVHCKDFTILCS
ncbi:hypothetical protein JHK82_013716 [Glycine max]|uniref:Uncharacterized protein n=1 Tax=Glycine max TaxID=3847 RepID=I1K614_SOYBN|nr:hypothetical protein JHK85_014090 [Glycine max]KAG5155747.1 hypothetical protein JHK82_013716 [Glycine max]KAH1135802.1 hypothetical protein GYH30_013490 [Glycine max]KRH60175.1 hypothetical protein GLYMA_05G224600v4 [Glycine max]